MGCLGQRDGEGSGCGSGGQGSCREPPLSAEKPPLIFFTGVIESAAKSHALTPLTAPKLGLSVTLPGTARAGQARGPSTRRGAAPTTPPPRHATATPQLARLRRCPPQRRTRIRQVPVPGGMLCPGHGTGETLGWDRGRAGGWRGGWRPPWGGFAEQTGGRRVTALRAARRGAGGKNRGTGTPGPPGCAWGAASRPGEPPWHG